MARSRIRSFSATTISVGIMCLGGSWRSGLAAEWSRLNSFSGKKSFHDSMHMALSYMYEFASLVSEFIGGMVPMKNGYIKICATTLIGSSSFPASMAFRATKSAMLAPELAPSSIHLL